MLTNIPKHCQSITVSQGPISSKMLKYNPILIPKYFTSEDNKNVIRIQQQNVYYYAIFSENDSEGKDLEKISNKGISWSLKTCKEEGGKNGKKEKKNGEKKKREKLRINITKTGKRE